MNTVFLLFIHCKDLTRYSQNPGSVHLVLCGQGIGPGPLQTAVILRTRVFLPCHFRLFLLKKEGHCQRPRYKLTCINVVLVGFVLSIALPFHKECPEMFRNGSGAFKSLSLLPSEDQDAWLTAQCCAFLWRHCDVLIASVGPGLPVEALVHRAHAAVLDARTDSIVRPCHDTMPLPPWRERRHILSGESLARPNFRTL